MLTLALNEDSRTAAKISFAEDRLGRLCRLNPAAVDITRRFAPERWPVENFIAANYAGAYGAYIEIIAYPFIMSVRDTEGRLLAAAGFRFASDEPLFLEQYTRAPIEQLVSIAYDQLVPRTGIVEIGNLVSASPGATVFLYAALAAYLNSKGLRYAVATGTRELHRQFLRLGLRPREICDANENALDAPGASTWGTYYDALPRVLSGSIANGLQRLKHRLGAEFSQHDRCTDA